MSSRITSLGEEVCNFAVTRVVAGRMLLPGFFGLWSIQVAPV